MRYVLLAIFGLIGIFARYSVNSVVANSLNLGFPAATTAINVLGSFLIGLTYVAGTQNIVLSEDLRIAIMAGLLGGFTTFSAFSLDSVSFFAEGRYLVGGLYIFGSMGGGIGATVLGLYIGKRVFGVA